MLYFMNRPESFNEQLSVTIIGGGTGSFTLLSELKTATPNITAVVNMSDDGGSTGRLRDELGVLPPGDVRQCLVALSNITEARDIFDFRFSTNGPLDEHSLGNLILSGLELRYGDFEKAIDLASKLLAVTGQVVPITTDQHTLKMFDGDEEIYGEFVIGHRVITDHNATICHTPTTTLNPRAEAAIINSDIIVIAPGNLYGSLLPALSVGGLKEAFQISKAKKVVVANLVTKPGQTDGWHVIDYVREIEKYCGKGTIDFALYNTKPPEQHLLDKYAHDGELPLDISKNRIKNEAKNTKYIGADLLAESIFPKDPADKSMPRTLIRHDAKKVVAKLMELAT